MNAKEYLSQARTLEARIQAKYERIRHWSALAERRTSVYGEHVRGGRYDRYDIVAKIADEKKKLDQEIDQLVTLKSEIEEAISQIPDDRMRTVLELRYLAGLEWNSISQKMHYCDKWIFKLHAQALKEIQLPLRERDLPEK